MTPHWLIAIQADPRWAQYYQQGVQATFTLNGVAIAPAP